LFEAHHVALFLAARKAAPAEQYPLSKGKQRLDATIYRIINERAASGVDRGDLLSMLLMAHDRRRRRHGMK